MQRSFASVPYEVHTQRVCCTPVTELNERFVAEVAAFSEESGLTYHGMDFSLAPLPRENNSVISILNALGVSRIDDTGVLFVTAFLTKLLKAFAHRYKSVGFSGVMYSLIEDHLYAQSNNQHGFSIDRMIALSTMCGCGVDMVPVPYDAPVRALRTILLETACVSSRLKKPLGVRLLPVKSDDGFTHFTMEEDFCINTKIVPLDSQSDIQFDDVFSFEVQSLLEN